MTSHDPDSPTTPPLRLVRDTDVPTPPPAEAPDHDLVDHDLVDHEQVDHEQVDHEQVDHDQADHERPAAAPARYGRDAAQRTPPADQTNPVAAQGPEAGRRRMRWTRGRRAVALLAAVVLALAVWSVHDRLTAPDAGTTGTTPVPVDGGQPSDPHAAAATKTAITYWTAVLALDADTACPLAENEQQCRQVLDAGKDLGPLELAEPIEALQTQTVTTGGGVTGDPVANTAVLLSYVVTGRDALRVAVLVRDDDGRVVDLEHIGPDQSGMTLAQVFEGQR